MTLQLDPVPASVRIARRWVAGRARESGTSPAVVQTLELVTSELVTNAVKYGPPGGTITVDARRTGDLFGVTVSDDSHDPPVPLDRGPGQLGGHGVRIVQALATGWGVELHDGNGKSVFFTVAV